MWKRGSFHLGDLFVLSIIILPFPCFSEVSQITLERTRSLSLVFSSIQCLTDSNTTGSSSVISDINHNFSPEDHLSEYKNPQVVKELLEFVNASQARGSRNDDPFTNTPEHISQLSLLLYVLYPNAHNWPLFYNTTAWLINRVNDAQLFWALMVVCGERFPNTVIAPTMVEVFPQLFLNKMPILEIAGQSRPNESNVTVEDNPLQYWLGDPGLNEFHTNWHMDNPFWWNSTLYGVKRPRRGELFLYMHHQLVCRYIAEQLSNGLPEVTPLELEPDYAVPEGYTPDVVNTNYRDFPSRRKEEHMKNWDDGRSLSELKVWYDRLISGIEQGYFVRTNGSQESLQFDNATDILGSSTEASAIEAVNREFYGNFHNALHRFLGGLSRKSWNIAGVEAHSETAIRDPVFFRLHKRVDAIYMKLKSMAPPYTQRDLDFPGVALHSIEIQTPRQTSHWDPRWPFNPHQNPVLTTYFTEYSYDISTAARPCRGIKDKPEYANVPILTHVPFKYVITIKSTRKEAAHGIIRIFMCPEFGENGKKFDAEECHQRAIELDRFRVNIEPNRDTVITRASLNSSITRMEPPPSIKKLYRLTSSSTSVLRPDMTRACGFPNNLLIPKGTAEGMKFKIIALVTEEAEREEFQNYPLCGTLTGIAFPDDRPMGFPFDRLQTKFVSYEGVCLILGGCFYKNVKEIKVIVKHREEESI